MTTTLPPSIGLQLFEVSDGPSPCTAGFGAFGNRKSTRSYYLKPESHSPPAEVTAEDLRTVIADILGQTDSVDTPTTDGTIFRTPPLADPVYPWLYAETISNITGFGKYTAESGSDLGNIPTVPDWSLYTAYKITVEFTPRNYTVALNLDIDTGTVTAYDIAGTSYAVPYAAEWIRYTDFTQTPSADSVTMQLGNMAFNSSVSPVNGRIFDSLPRLFLPDGILTITYYQVPWRFISSSNSYINSSLRGRVNQNAFPPVSANYGASEMRYPAGSLLYMNYKPIRYTMAYPNISALATYNAQQSKLCDIEFTFLYTNRQLPSGENYGSAPSSSNFIVAGHNLQPWAGDRRFHYAQTNPSTGAFTLPGGIPSYYSFPFELLFCDPDTTGIAGVYPVTS